MNNSSNYVSRGAYKLIAALDEFKIDVAGKTAADFGASTGGFVDALLERGAKHVYAIEKGFGVLEWKLRNDPRVSVMEKTDGRSVKLPQKVDIVTIDIGFTHQAEILPIAIGVLKPGGHVVSLLKPQYEANGHELERGQLTENATQAILNRVIDDLKSTGINIKQIFTSPVKGGRAHAQEYFLLIEDSNG